jgi:aldehyde:ferredoxin oxidoreductase
MALGLSTSSIGAHHKESWVVGWEINFDRHSYDSQKAAKVIEHQRIRGGIMECLVTCKFPYADMGLTVPYYVRLFEAATGIKLSIDDINALGDRIYSLIRAFWVREYGPRWNRTLDYPPARWFEEAPQKGPERGVKLDRQGYDRLLNNYYEMRGWDHNGVPLSSTLRQQGLADVAQAIGSMQRIG